VKKRMERMNDKYFSGGIQEKRMKENDEEREE
jgi:hypothetical protein